MYVCISFFINGKSYNKKNLKIWNTIKRHQKTIKIIISARHANKLSTLIPFQPTFPPTHPIQRNNAQHTATIQQRWNTYNYIDYDGLEWISVDPIYYYDKCTCSKSRNRKGWNIWLRSFNKTHWGNICLTQPTFTIRYPPFDIIFKLTQIINVFILLRKHCLPHNGTKISKRQFSHIFTVN